MKSKIGIVALSSRVPDTELELGLRKMKAAGLDFRVHPDVLNSHLFFSGTDLERANALIEYAQDPELDTLWAARGGYGAMRLLPLLEEWTRKNGKPSRKKKCFVGFSDSSCLFQFLHKKWGWDILHAPMPGLRKFYELPEKEWEATLAQLKSSKVQLEYRGLKKIHPISFRGATGQLWGGNLTTLNALLGSRFELRMPQQSLLFLEDTDEALYRLDRMIQQLLLSGRLKGVQAVILGNFLNCHDVVPRVLAQVPRPGEEQKVLGAVQNAQAGGTGLELLKPLRAKLESEKTVHTLFSEITRIARIPVFAGLPVGHGPEKYPLWIGKKYHLSAQGRLKCE